jgi:hypothetical protein
LLRKIGSISESDFKEVILKLQNLLKIESPLAGAFSEAEATNGSIIEENKNIVKQDHKIRVPIDQLPEVIQKYGFDFHLDNNKVWKLDIPVEEINISELEWIFDHPFWTDKTRCDLCPRKVIENINLYPEHKKRILNADISHPVDIMKNQLGNWLILDGLHRLVRLFMEGNKKVKVRKISREFIYKIEPKE